VGIPQGVESGISIGFVMVFHERHLKSDLAIHWAGGRALGGGGAVEAGKGAPKLSGPKDGFFIAESHSFSLRSY
jgi:hypothetical protein